MRRLFSLLAIAALVGATGISSPAQSGNPADKGDAKSAPPTPLLTNAVTIAGRNWTSTIPATGTLWPNEAVEIVPEIQQRIVRINAEEGQEVAAGDLLFTLDDRTYQSQLETLQTRRKMAVLTEDRLKKLVAKDAATREQLDEATNALELIDNQIEELNIPLSKARIRAPFAGTLGVRLASKGALVSPSDVLTTLYDISKLKLDFSLPEKYSAMVKAGVAVTFQVEGLPDTFSAAINVIDPQIAPQTRGQRVRALVDNTERKLRPGMFATVRMVRESKSDQVIIPTYALVPSSQGQRVFVAEDGVARLRPIRTGDRTEAEVQVIDGLKPGETLLVSNVLRLRDGVPVTLLREGDDWRKPPADQKKD